MFSLLGKLTGRSLLYLCTLLSRYRIRILNSTQPDIAFLQQEISRLSSANRIMKQFIRKSRVKPSFLIKLRMVLFVLGFRISLRRIHSYLPVTRSTIRRYITIAQKSIFGLRAKSSRPKGFPRKTPPAIAALVHKIKQDNPSWGYLRIALHLWRMQVFLSPSTVRRILLGPPTSPGRIRYHDAHRKITATKPNELWSLDLTTVYIFGVFPVHVLGVIDHFSRKVFCLSSTLHPTAEWAVHELKTVFSSFGVPRALITDNGAQFVSSAFKKLAASRSFTHIKTAVRHPQTNGKIERFFQSLKHEFIRLFFLTGKRRLDGLLSGYLLYYNRYRLHEAIDGQTPDDVYFNRLIPKPGKSSKLIRAPIEEIRMGDGLLRAYRLKQAA